MGIFIWYRFQEELKNWHYYLNCADNSQQTTTSIPRALYRSTCVSQLQTCQGPKMKMRETVCHSGEGAIFSGGGEKHCLWCVLCLNFLTLVYILVVEPKSFTMDEFGAGTLSLCRVSDWWSRTWILASQVSIKVTREWELSFLTTKGEHLWH